MRKLLLAMLATVVAFMVLRWESAPLITASTPTGILALEFCKSPVKADMILSAWSIPVATWAVIIDFFFLAAYGAVFYFGSVTIASRLQNSRLRMFGHAMIGFSLIAPVLDIVENIGMLITLSGARSNWLLRLTCYAAWVKFACAAVVVLYLLVSLPLNYAISKKTAVPR
jgi:hypothetical protein